MTNYNPMSKEFQEEANKLGLTGRQLTAKYQKEGKYIEKDLRKPHEIYTKKQLLDILVQSYKDLGRPPTRLDFTGNSKYPNFKTYINQFGNWSKALKLVGLDVDSMVKKGIVENNYQKGRFAEITIRDSFDNPSIDLAGENCNSHCDGICPKGLYYDVKSSGLDFTGRFYLFHISNKHKDKIEIYYFLAFNKDYTKLEYGWRIPGDIVESNLFCVGLNFRYKFNIENMKQYDITDKLREVLNKYGYFEKIKNYIKAKEKGMTIYEYDKQLYDGCIIAE